MPENTVAKKLVDAVAAPIALCITILGGPIVLAIEGLKYLGEIVSKRTTVTH